MACLHLTTDVTLDCTMTIQSSYRVSGVTKNSGSNWGRQNPPKKSWMGHTLDKGAWSKREMTNHLAKRWESSLEYSRSVLETWYFLGAIGAKRDDSSSSLGKTFLPLVLWVKAVVVELYVKKDIDKEGYKGCFLKKVVKESVKYHMLESIKLFCDAFLVVVKGSAERVHF